MSEENQTNDEGTNIPTKRIVSISMALFVALIAAYFVFFQMM